MLGFGSVVSTPSLVFAISQTSMGSILEERVTPIGPEISQTLYRLNSNSKNQRVYKLEANPKNENFKLKSSLAGDALYARERTTAQANRISREGNRVVGAVNGDFYGVQTGFPIGAMVSEGEIITTSNDWRGFGITSTGEAMIGVPRFNVNFSYDGRTASVKHINRIRNANDLILYTPKHGETTKTNDFGTEVVLRVTRGRVEAGTTLKAQVESVNVGRGNSRLESGKLVLSGHGIGAQNLNGLTVGQEVDLSFSAQGNWQNAVEVIGGNSILVQDGKIQAGLETARHPRTALGIKSNGNIIAVVVDGRQPGYSEGVGLGELARMMVDMGAVHAINLDGGGSSTFASRKPGETSLSVVNSLSDGSERAVGNSLLFMSTAESGTLDKLAIEPGSLKILKGSSYSLSARGVDKYYNPVNISSPITWSVEGPIGEISSDGTYRSGDRAAKGKIRARSGNVTGEIPVEVIDSVNEIRLAQSSYSLESGESIKLKADGFIGASRVMADNSSFDWQVVGDIGTIDQNGVFKASQGSGLQGRVVVSLNGVRAEANITVGKEPVVVENFESNNLKWQGSGVNYTSKDVRLVSRPEGGQVYSGNRSLKLGYDFTGKTGTSGVYAGLDKPYSIPGYPKKIGMWVHGDGNGHWLRGQIRDGNNNPVHLDFTSIEKGVDWTGWRYVEASVPSGTSHPLKLDLGVRYMRTKAGSPARGTIYIDDITAVYSESLGTVSPEPPVEEDMVFSDMRNHWSRDNVESLYEKGIVNGMKSTDGKLIFNPDRGVTRQEFAKLIVEAEGLELADYDNLSDFSDVDTIDSWAKPYISTAYKAGLIQGHSDGNGNMVFAPKDSITRSQIATIIGRTMEGDIDGETSFKDNADIPDWAKRYVLVCVQRGIVNGTPEGYFQGDKGATRAESAVMIYRLISAN